MVAYLPGSGRREAMHIIRIERPDDSRIAEFAHLSDPQLLRARGLFVAEGRLVVARVLVDRRHVMRAVLLSDAAFAAMSAELESAGADVPVFVCPTEYFLPITGFDIHRGCLALVERPALSAAGELLRGARLVVVLEGVANPDNIGGVFRNASAFGADAVLLSPTCSDPLYRKAIRTAMGATLTVPFAELTPWPGALSIVQSAGFHVAAFAPRAAARTLDAYVADRPAGHVALLFGAEGSGVSPAAEAAADALVRIPISSAVDSLNVAVAAGIALHRLSSVAGSPPMTT
jgi:tRNA G18 (ribose-2'-O)-methylase SpoU